MRSVGTARSENPLVHFYRCGMALNLLPETIQRSVLEYAWAGRSTVKFTLLRVPRLLIHQTMYRMAMYAFPGQNLPAWVQEWTRITIVDGSRVSRLITTRDGLVIVVPPYVMRPPLCPMDFDRANDIAGSISTDGRQTVWMTTDISQAQM